MSRRAGNLNAFDAREPYDVCIVGASMAGTLLGLRLVQAELRVLLIESRPALPGRLFDPRARRLGAYQLTGDTDYPSERSDARSLLTNRLAWTGLCERFHPSDFERHPYTPNGNPWPVTYADLEPYYDHAEHTMHVRGGPFSDHMPPRSCDLRHRGRADITSLRALMAGFGIVIDDWPVASSSRGSGAFDPGRELLPEFTASPNGTLVSGVSATRLKSDAHGRILGITCKTIEGVEKTARAHMFVLACGGLQIPRLLLLSRSPRFPNGVGNDKDRVGRGLTDHPVVRIYARIPHNRHTVWPMHKLGHSHQFYQQFRLNGLGAIHPTFAQSYLPDHACMARNASDAWSARKAAAMCRTLLRAARAAIGIASRIEMKPVDQNRVTLSRSMTDSLGDPLPHLHLDYTAQDRRLIAGARELMHACLDRVGASDREEPAIAWTQHAIGTCRMGDDPSTSVCDSQLRVHACPNLYVAGAAVFPTSAALSPELTVAALAHRLADHLTERFRWFNRSTLPTRRRSNVGMRPRLAVVKSTATGAVTGKPAQIREPVAPPSKEVSAAEEPTDSGSSDNRARGSRWWLIPKLLVTVSLTAWLVQEIDWTEFWRTLERKGDLDERHAEQRGQVAAERRLRAVGESRA